LYNQGQVDKAHALAMSLAKSSGAAAAWQLAGETAFELGQIGVAETAYMKLVQAQSSAANWYRLGSVQVKAGKTTAAKTSFQKALAINPQHGPSLKALERLGP
jgi:tetratricopeptide (TPR) repeat protein